MKNAKSTPSEDWSQGHLEKVCRALKNSKAPDNERLIYELFKPQNCENGLISALTKLFNEVKSQQKFQAFFNQCQLLALTTAKVRRIFSEISAGYLISQKYEVCWTSCYSMISMKLCTAA